MNSLSKKRFRVQSVLSCFGKSVFLTLTTPDKCDLLEIRRRWRIFRHDYFRSIKHPKYVMVFEPHTKGHGWHVHVVIEDAFLPVNEIRRFSIRAMFGRIHIERVRQGSDVAWYLCKYLTKSIKASSSLGIQRYRLINVSRGLSRLCDISSDCSLSFVARHVSSKPLPCLDGLNRIGRYKYVYYYLLFGSYFACYNAGLEHYIDEAWSLWRYRDFLWNTDLYS